MESVRHASACHANAGSRQRQPEIYELTTRVPPRWREGGGSAATQIVPSLPAASALGLLPNSTVSVTCAVCASSRKTLPAGGLATQIAPPEAATLSTPGPTAPTCETEPDPASILETVPSCAFVTQTLFPTTAIPRAPFPTEIVWTTTRLRGSISLTVAVSPLATQIAPAPAASASGRPATRTTSVSIPRPGSTRDTVPSSTFATHTAPSPTATAPAPLPTAMSSRTTVLEAGLIWESVRPVASVTQTAPSPAAMPPGVPRTRMTGRSSRSGSIRDTVPSTLFATQTDPRPTVTAVGPFPTGV